MYYQSPEWAVIVKVDAQGPEQQLGAWFNCPNPYAFFMLLVIHDTAKYQYFSTYRGIKALVLPNTNLW